MHLGLLATLKFMSTLTRELLPKRLKQFLESIHNASYKFPFDSKSNELPEKSQCAILKNVGASAQSTQNALSLLSTSAFSCKFIADYKEKKVYLIHGLSCAYIALCVTNYVLFNKFLSK